MLRPFTGAKPVFFSAGFFGRAADSGCPTPTAITDAAAKTSIAGTHCCKALIAETSFVAETDPVTFGLLIHYTIGCNIIQAHSSGKAMPRQQDRGTDFASRKQRW